MADENYLEYLIGLRLELLDSSTDIAKALDDIRKKHGDLIKDANKLKDAYGSIVNGVNSIADSYVKSNKKISTVNKKQLRQIRRAKKTLRDLGRLFRKIFAVAVPASITAALKITTEYNAALVESFAVVSRFGYGLGQLQSSIESLSLSLSINRREAAALFGEFAMGMREVSLVNFEKGLRRMTKMYGPNIKAIQKMQNAMSSLSQTYPDIVRSLNNIENINKNILQQDITRLYNIGEIEQSQYRLISAYIDGYSQISDADRADLERRKQGIEAWKTLLKYAEDFSLALGEMILPAVEKIAKGLQYLNREHEGWHKWLIATVAAVLGIKTAFGLVSLAGVAAGTAISGAFAPVLAIAATLFAAVKVGKAIGEAIFQRKENRQLKEAEALNARLTKRLEEQKRRREELAKSAEEEAARAEAANREQEQRVKAINALLGIQISYTKTLGEYVSMMGGEGADRVVAANKETVALMRREIEEREKQLAILKNQDKLTEKDIDNNKVLTSETKERLKILMKGAGESVQNILATLVGQKAIRAEEEKTLALRKQIVDITISSMESIRKDIRRNAELEAAHAQNMINLADNYAIGVGASAAMRMRLYEAEGRRIEELGRMRDLIVARMSEENITAEENMILQNKLLEIDNQRLQAMQSQNQAVKALRDGWVSAISAMQTGMGGFSEIIMNAQTNVAQMQRLTGAVRTSFSGAFGRRGEDVGFRRSQRFGLGGAGDIVGSRGGRQLSYLTQADRAFGIGLGGPSFLQYRARGEAMAAISRDMGLRGAMATRRGGGALGMTGHMVGSVAAGSPNVNADLNFSRVNMHVNIKDINSLANTLSDQIRNAVGEITIRAIESGVGEQ